MRKWVQFSLCALFMMVQLPAHAALNLELTQGIRSAIPVAIVPFEGEAQAVVPGNTTITQVIKNDLQNSGQFRVEAPGALAQNPTSAAQVDFQYWRKKGVNDLILGKVVALSGGRYQVTFQLIDLYKGDKQQSAKSILLQQVFTAEQAGLRDLAHHISDLIYQQLTGVRGIFATKIAYIVVQRFENKPPNYILEVADADGFSPKPLLESHWPIMSPSWSPDGRQIVYVSFEDQLAAIYLQNLQSGQRQLISRFPGINGAPAISPDGKKLALVLTKTGNPKIYVMDLKTKALTQITKGFSIDTEPSWAPDGKTLLFTSNRGGTPQIYQYNFANQQIGRLTFDGNYNAKASYLPNEQGIVMMHRETGLFGIASQDLNSGQVQVLTQSGNDESPSLAPNGKMVLYATQYGGRGVLGVVSTDGRIKLRLPAREGNVQEPAWSPFLQG